MSSYRSGRDSWRAPGTDSYRPQRPTVDLLGPPPPPKDMYFFKSSYDSASSNRQHPRRDPRSKPPRRQNDRRGFQRRPQTRASERPLLSLDHDGVAQPMLSNPSSDAKFRNLDELTDSEEEAMAQSDEDEGQLPSKRPRLERNNSAQGTITQAEETRTPKWSNPDPYTSLPPLAMDESASGKRIDVVKLIRKARVDSTRKADSDAQRDTDFISFEDLAAEDLTTSLPPRHSSQLSTTAAGVLGKRKRGGNVLSGQSVVVLSKWAVVEDTDAAPWITTISPSDSPGIALHREIIDFYDWVRPKDYEAAVRTHVFQRLSRELNRFRAGQLQAFGSYAAGLYLPTGDMDLVFMRHGYKPRTVQGLPEKPSMTMLHDFKRFLKQQRICDHAQVITAKVPIIKFVDKVSGLKVDLSFDNSSGVVAIETFEKWKKTYPAMPILVSIIKQFLMMRGLNDVATEGLGGFSTICLVTSFLQHLPGLQKHANLGELLLEFFNYYGNVFDRRSVAIRLDPPAFVDKDSYRPYLFKPNEDADRLTIIDPNQHANNISGGTKKIGLIFECFSHAYSLLQNRLTQHESLSKRDRAQSFLKDIVGGYFKAYEDQRAILHQMHEAILGPVPTQTSSLTTSISSMALKSSQTVPGILTGKATPKPNTLDAKSDIPPLGKPQKPAGQSGIKNSTSAPNQAELSVPSSAPESSTEGLKLSRSEKLALRFKLHRPDLKHKIGVRLTRHQAVQLGGYKSYEQMHEEFVAKDAATAKAKGKKP